MYRKILVPLDGSKRAEAILPHVEELALCYKAQVLFLRVVEPTAAVTQPSWGVESQFVEQEMNDAKLYLAGLQGEFREKGIQAEALVAFGLVVATILDAAQRENVDLIAMASHGRSGLARVFYGSVAAGVLHGVDRPLLLVRATNNE